MKPTNVPESRDLMAWAARVSRGRERGSVGAETNLMAMRPFLSGAA